MLTFAYACPVKYGNPMGNRISKTVTDMTGKKAPFTTYYTRDAQGNTMAVYDNSSLKSDIAICELDRPYLEQISRNIITYKAKSLIAEEDDFYQNSINEYISQNWQDDSCKYKYMSLISEKNIPCFIEQEDYNIIEQLYYQDFGYFQSVETSARKSYLSQKYNEYYENMGDRTYCFIQELSIAMEQPIDAFEAWLMHQKRTDLRSKLDEFYTELAQTSIYYGILNDTAYQDSLYWKEQHLYGSSRLGMAKPNVEVTNYKNSNFSLLTSNFKNYELTNHLGNVLATIKDEKQQIDQNADGIVDYYEPIVITANDYYPFGMVMPNRSFSLAGSKYRFGYQGSEKDNEDYGSGNLFTTHFRVGDVRIARWWSTDPKEKEMPWQTPYNLMDNNPILLNDPKGDCPTCDQTLSGMWRSFKNSISERNNETFNKVRNATTTKFHNSNNPIINVIRPIIYSKIDNFSYVVSIPIGSVASQMKTIFNEGVHEGRAYDSKNAIEKPFLRFDTKKGEFYRTKGMIENPTLEDASPLLNATTDIVTSIIPSNGFYNVSNKQLKKVYDYTEKQVRNNLIKSGVKEGINEGAIIKNKKK